MFSFFEASGRVYLCCKDVRARRCDGCCTVCALMVDEHHCAGASSLSMHGSNPQLLRMYIIS